ncbi:hypothetical protein ACFE04_026431 [Oxalis oulophora]
MSIIMNWISSINTELSKPTSVFGIRLWVLIGIVLGSLILIVLFLFSLCCLTYRRRKPKPKPKPKPEPNILPITTKHELIVHHPPPSAPVVVVCDNQTMITSGESNISSISDNRGTTGSELSNVGPDLGWGKWYTLRELEIATDGFIDENVIGEGGYGIVYAGVLVDGTQVAVKNLLNNNGQAEREFKAEVEVIGRVRHKNLVRLLGYCIEGAHRMLVYEYIDNGNLEQWLHGDVGEVSPLTWDIRTNIIIGTAKGLAYLHEGLEPKVVHRDVKSSNILLDRQWYPKVSDFGLAKLICSDKSYVTTRVHLVEWLKNMVGDRRSEEVVDPKMPEMPASKPLKRLLLVALRCVDPDPTKRPKMGHVIHMLEADELLSRDERRIGREISHSRQSSEKTDAVPKLGERQWGEGASYTTTSEVDSSTTHDDHLARWR